MITRTLYGITDQPTNDDAVAVLEIVETGSINDEVIGETLQRCKEHDRYAAIHTGKDGDIKITILRAGITADVHLSEKEVQQAKKLDALMNPDGDLLTDWRAYKQAPLTEDGYRVVFWEKKNEHK